MLRGTPEVTKQAHALIAALIKDPDVDILQMLPKTSKAAVSTTLWDKTQIGVSVSYLYYCITLYSNAGQPINDCSYH